MSDIPPPLSSNPTAAPVQDPNDKTDAEIALREIIDVFVPVDITLKDEKIRDTASRCVAREDLQELVKQCMPLRHAEEAWERMIIRLLSTGSQDMITIKSIIYSEIRSSCDFSELFGRTLTAGVEQCPFWNNYETAPELSSSESKSGSK
ncbi:MAG: hypothetical protein ABF537_07650 [Acetobacter sp.]|uniref:hypothetical protein n=1 Tax=Acetobacter sp. TaxID=440 RepID=UPI0039EA6236